MRRLTVPACVVIAIAAALTFAIMTRDHEWGDDWAAYILQAVSITQGSTREFVARNSFTIRESTRFMGPVAYPWGFPVILAPMVVLCGPDVFCLKLINIAFFALFLAVWFLFLKKRLSRLDAHLLLAVFAVNPVLLEFSNNVLSDLPFLFLSMTIVLLIDAVVAGTRGSSHPRWWGVALGAMIFVASTVRTIGLLFVPTLIVTHAILLLRLSQPTASKERFLPVAIIPYAVFGLLILTLILVLPIGEGSHVEHLISLTPRVLLRNTAAYVAMPAAFFQSLPCPGVLHGVLLPFALSGAVLRGRTEFHVLAYLALTFGMLVTWPDRQGIRFLFPILPFFVYFAHQGMQATAFALAERYRRVGDVITRLFWALVIVGFAASSIGHAYRNLRQNRAPLDGPFGTPSVELFDFLKESTEPDSVILFREPRALRLMTNRDALMVDDCAHLGKGRYVALERARGSLDQIDPERVTSCNPDLVVDPVFANQAYTVYRITPRPH